MVIKNITLYNYRLYYGKNSIDFNVKDNRNLFIITGENGFGKTTFLHSLIWCLYGKNASEVDEDSNRETLNSSYVKIQKSNLNVIAQEKLKLVSDETKKDIAKKGYNGFEEIKSYSTYYVSMEFAEVMIPSVPCKSLKIIRSYDSITSKEETKILIDGRPSELTEDMGADIFINDFILSRDIARFFFFDSERIVSLAETTTKSNRQRLSSAYNEVLGVKKYEDLKSNLENLRLRFRRHSDDIANRRKLENLVRSEKSLKDRQDKLNSLSEQIISTLSDQRKMDEQYQISLMREGSSMTLEKYKTLQLVKEKGLEKDKEYKSKLKDFLEEAPFAIVGKLFNETKSQIVQDYKISQSVKDSENLTMVINGISLELKNLISTLPTSSTQKEDLSVKVEGILSKYKGKQVDKEPLLNVPKAMYDDFLALYTNIVTTYKSEFEHLADDYKKNRQLLERTSRRIANMQNQENDNLIKEIRSKKNILEKQIASNETRLRAIHESLGIINDKLQKVKEEIQETSKTISLAADDVNKDKLAEELIEELNVFLVSLREQKKDSLERRIKGILNSLMHKPDFIGRVEVLNSSEDDMKINLYTPQGILIDKDGLSKGEQQLYATSLLKALVEESGIQFPVFIDSPLQKFDKDHADRIIKEFYPSISKQVILFPLLYKEINKGEVEAMKDILNESYIIKNDTDCSHFEKIDIEQLMK